MHTLSLPALGSSDTEASPALNVVIAYEDLETGKRAMKTYDYLVEHLGDQCLFANQMWKFDVLAVAKLKEIAAKAKGETKAKARRGFRKKSGT